VGAHRVDVPTVVAPRPAREEARGEGAVHAEQAGGELVVEAAEGGGVGAQVPVLALDHIVDGEDHTRHLLGGGA